MLSGSALLWGCGALRMQGVRGCQSKAFSTMLHNMGVVGELWVLVPALHVPGHTGGFMRLAEQASENCYREVEGAILLENSRMFCTAKRPHKWPTLFEAVFVVGLGSTPVSVLLSPPRPQLVQCPVRKVGMNTPLETMTLNTEVTKDLGHTPGLCQTQCELSWPKPTMSALGPHGSRQSLAYQWVPAPSTGMGAQQLGGGHEVNTPARLQLLPCPFPREQKAPDRWGVLSLSCLNMSFGCSLVCGITRKALPHQCRFLCNTDCLIVPLGDTARPHLSIIGRSARIPG